MKSWMMIVGLALLAVGCTSMPVINLQNQMVPTGAGMTQLSQNDVQQAILAAAEKRGWTARVVQPGLIEARILVRVHRASVQIPYTASTYSINYESSENLNYTGTSIHKNYNNWVTYLDRSIQQELDTRASGF